MLFIRYMEAVIYEAEDKFASDQIKFIAPLGNRADCAKAIK